MENKEDDLVKALGNMSVMELIALTKKLESDWGVKALPQVKAYVPPTSVPTVTEQTEFDVVLLSYPVDKKISLVKVVKELTGLGLKEAKDLIEAAPKKIKEGMSKADAETLLARLIEAGGQAEIK